MYLDFYACFINTENKRKSNINILTLYIFYKLYTKVLGNFLYIFSCPEGQLQI